MAEKKHTLKWELTDDYGKLTVIRARDGYKGNTVDMAEIFPGFAEMPEYAQFLCVYAVKQKTADKKSSLSGDEKFKAVNEDFTLDEIQKFTFARESAGSGISWKVKAEEEAKARMADAQQLLAVLMKMAPKARMAFIAQFSEDYQATLAEIATKLNIDITK